MKVKIARLNREYLSEYSVGLSAGLKSVDIIFFKYRGEYYRLRSYSKRVSHKGKKFSARRWISRHSISIFSLRNYHSLLLETLYKTRIEKVRARDLMLIFTHYRVYLENCGKKFDDITLLEDFDVIV